MKRQINVNRLLDRICVFIRENPGPFILGSIVITCFAPFLFTRTAFCDNLIFSETGQIGDTIGGITAPFIGIINILLLVLTLRAQLHFNMDQAHDNTVSQLLSLQSEIIHMNERIIFSYTNEKEFSSKGNGIESLSLLQWGNDGTPRITLREMNYLLRQIDPFIRLCNCYTLLVGNMKQDDDDLSSFTKYYKTMLNNFFDDIDKLSITSFPGDDYSDEDVPSEIDLMKRRAKNMQEILR